MSAPIASSQVSRPMSMQLRAVLVCVLSADDVEGRAAHVAQLPRDHRDERRVAVLRQVTLHLHRYHLAEPSLEALLLDRRQQVLRLLGVRDLQVGVAREAEVIAGEHLHPREERVEPRRVAPS